MKKTLALLLLVILLGTNSAVAQQADRLSITPYYSHTFNIFAGLEINGGVATCCGTVTGRYNYSSIFRLSTTHLETATHNVCGTFHRCAY